MKWLSRRRGRLRQAYQRFTGALVDIWHYALRRLGNPEPTAVDLLSEAMDGVIMLGMGVLIREKTRAAVYIADRKRLERAAEEEDAEAARWARRVERCRGRGDEVTAEKAHFVQREHETLAETLRDAARLKQREVDVVVRELRSYIGMFDAASLANREMQARTEAGAGTPEQQEMKQTKSTMAVLHAIVAAERLLAKRDREASGGPPPGAGPPN